MVIDEKLQASSKTGDVAIASRLNVDLLANSLQEALKVYCRGRLLDLGCGEVPLY